MNSLNSIHDIGQQKPPQNSNFGLTTFWSIQIHTRQLIKVPIDLGALYFHHPLKREPLSRCLCWIVEVLN